MQANDKIKCLRRRWAFLRRRWAFLRLRWREGFH